MLSRNGLIVILAFLAFAYVMFLTFIVYKLSVKSSNSKKALKSSGSKFKSSNISPLVDDAKKENTACENGIITKYQTKFFRESMEHAEKVLKTHTILDAYKYGTWYDLTKIDDTTKSFIVIAIKYMSIEPTTARALENQYRAISEAERVPLWLVILHQAIKQVIVPNSTMQAPNETQTMNQMQKFQSQNQPAFNPVRNSESTYQPKIIPFDKKAA